MRLYLKLLLMILVFAGAGSSPGRRATCDIAYDIRVAWVWRFGSAADFEALIDDTHQMLARDTGSLKTYEAGKRYKQLLAERCAAAARRGTTLSDDDLARIAAEAFGPPPSSSAAKEQSSGEPEVLSGVIRATTTHSGQEASLVSTCAGR